MSDCIYIGASCLEGSVCIVAICPRAATTWPDWIGPHPKRSEDEQGRHVAFE